MRGFLELQIDALNLRIDRFAENGYDRQTIEMGDTTYSLLGAPIDDGGHYEAPYAWTIQAILTLQEWHLLQAIFRQQEFRRRTITNYAVRLHDTINKHVDVSATPSRLTVPGTLATALPGDGVAYFAQFDVRLLQPKATIGQNQVYPYTVQFLLKELDRVAV